jgi:ribosome maturation protein SDO1
MRGLSDAKEKIEMSTARFKSHGHEFEIVIDPDYALKFRHGEADIKDALKAPHIYTDSQKGERAGEELLKLCFNSEDENLIAAKIITEGELHFEEEYKEALIVEKKKRIIEILSRDGVDANTGLPVNAQKISTALSQAKVNIDAFKRAEDQIAEILQRIRPVLALTLERKILNIRIPAAHAAKLYGSVASKSRIIDESWLSDGSWSSRVELAAGQAALLIDELKKATHGDAEVSIEAKKR